MKKIVGLLLIVFLITITACENDKEELLIVTTTSLDNSGLLAYILPLFEEEYDCEVHVVATGTGAALELGSLGEADILLVHDLEREMKFVDDGFGEKRKSIMYNDFVFVGPSSLGSGDLESFLENLLTVDDFYSRGDNSGTHAREVRVFEEYNYDIDSFDNWYNETGQGMGATLNMASLNQGYTFTDRGTYLSMKSELDLMIVYENQEELINTYGIIKVSESLHNRNPELANLFYEWISRSDIQDYIDSYIIDNQQLFYALREE